MSFKRNKKSSYHIHSMYVENNAQMAYKSWIYLHAYTVYTNYTIQYTVVCTVYY